jgi:arsenate reductase (glutaredoxin)
VNIQIFGTRKCQNTRKAERFFRERGVRVQMIDLAEKGMSPGELRSVAARVGGLEALVDREGKRYVEKGLKYAAPTGPRLEELLLGDPLLLRTPVVRNGQMATLHYQPDVWAAWIKGERGG